MWQTEGWHTASANVHLQSHQISWLVFSCEKYNNDESKHDQSNLHKLKIMRSKYENIRGVLNWMRKDTIEPMWYLCRCCEFVEEWKKPHVMCSGNQCSKSFYKWCVKKKKKHCPSILGSTDPSELFVCFFDTCLQKYTERLRRSLLNINVIQHTNPKEYI